MKSFGYIIILCSLAILAACKKSENISPTEQILQAGIWQISASTTTYKYMGSDTTIDHYSKWELCEQDDLLVFASGGEGTTSENTNKCPEDKQLGYFNWELLNNDTQLKLTIEQGYFIATGTNTFTTEIMEISNTQLKFRSVKNSSSGSEITIETYKNIRR